MKNVKLGILVMGIIALVSCSTDQEISVISMSYLFNESDQGWTGDFADYPEGDSITFQLVIKHDTIPTGTSVNSTASGLLVSGKNLNDDLFMFIKKKISGLRPNTQYEVLFNVKFASNAPTDVIINPPGESVILKVGATVVEPKKILDAGVYRMNIDKGNQDEEGSDMINIGHVGVSATTTKFTVINRSNSSSNGFILTTDATGEVWLVVGSDSGFVGTSTLYYTQVDAAFNAVD
jgi:hypothetical protein